MQETRDLGLCLPVATQHRTGDFGELEKWGWAGQGCRAADTEVDQSGVPGEGSGGSVTAWV